MPVMVRDLEQRIANGERYAFKSAGERRIAGYLEGCGIRHDYERPLLVIDQGKPKIWYPDFYLPGLAVYLERFGIVADEGYCYDRGLQHKRNVYAAMDLDVIPLYPATFRTDWRTYILVLMAADRVRQGVRGASWGSESMSG